MFTFPKQLKLFSKVVGVFHFQFQPRVHKGKILGALHLWSTASSTSVKGLANTASINFFLTTVTNKGSIYVHFLASSSMNIYSSIFNSCTEGGRGRGKDREGKLSSLPSLLVAALGMEAGASHSLGKYTVTLSPVQALRWISRVLKRACFVKLPCVWRTSPESEARTTNGRCFDS